MTRIDLIITTIVIISFILGLFRGFVRTLFGCFGGILSFIAAAYISSTFSTAISDGLIAPKLSKKIAESITEKTGGSISAAELWNNQSDYLRGLLRGVGVSEDTLSSAAQPIKSLSDAIASAVGESMAYAVLFCISFVLCMFILSALAKALDLAAHLPILHSFNALLGGVLGAAFSLVLCTAILWALKLFVPYIYTDYGFLPPSEMCKSQIASTLVGWNDGVSLFEIIPE